jgi:hydrogenase maturation protease
MPDLRQQLQQLLEGRVCLLGLGNVACGDDGFGVRLAEALIASPSAPGIRARVIVAGTTPERVISRAAIRDCDHLILLDAVEFGGAPGSAVLLNSDEMVARFPQVSTHKLSLGLLARQAESNGRTRAWLLGVQPQSLRPGEELTPAVQTTLHLLFDLIQGCLEALPPGGRASPRALTFLPPEPRLGSRGRSSSPNCEVRA